MNVGGKENCDAESKMGYLDLLIKLDFRYIINLTYLPKFVNSEDGWNEAYLQLVYVHK